VWRFVTYPLAHGEVVGMVFNMLCLYWFGPDLETRLGTARFARFWLGTTLAAAVVFCVGWMSAPVPLFGATAPLMGIMALYAMFWPRRVVLFMLLVPMRMWVMALVMAAMSLYFAAFDPIGGTGALAALGGAAYAVAWFATRAWRERSGRGLRRRLDARAARLAAQDEEELDRVLEKVHAHGLPALTRSEKRFLKRISHSRRA
jgi:membrane associated rhomboid family serine protease